MDQQIIDAANDVFDEYYGVTLPTHIVVDLLLENPILQDEAKDGGISDTCVREVLMDSLCKKYNIPSWPCYGNTEEYKKDFKTKFRAFVSTVNGKIHWRE